MFKKHPKYIKHSEIMIIDLHVLSSNTQETSAPDMLEHWQVKRFTQTQFVELDPDLDVMIELLSGGSS